MTKPSFKRVIHHVTRLALALVFVLAGAVKLGDIPEFAAQIGDFGLVHDALVVPTAWTVACAELVTGLALAVNLRGSLVCALALLVAFLGVLVYGINLGLDIDCGCFGPGYHVTLKTQLLIDLGLVLWCGLVYWSRKKCRIQTVNPVALSLRFLGRRKPTA